MDFRNMLYLKAIELDKTSNGRFGKIFKRALNSISRLLINEALFKSNVE
nr:MAG TPA_asm: hypothetical protein [Bacteriophage sp.]